VTVLWYVLPVPSGGVVTVTEVAVGGLFVIVELVEVATIDVVEVAPAPCADAGAGIGARVCGMRPPR
jgi:hypothetical protein